VAIELDWPADDSADLAAASVHAFGRGPGLDALVALLAELEITATFFVCGAFARRRRHTLERLALAGHELALLSEREDDLVALQHAGLRPVGHRAAAGTATWSRLERLGDHGFTYDSTLSDDDRPYVLDLASGALVEIPLHWSTDDRVAFDSLQPENGLRLVQPAAVFAELIESELAARQRYGGTVVLTLNPRRSGRAARLRALGGVLTRARDTARIATLAEIAASAQADTSIERRPLRRPQIEAYS
jgi:peptidoglycan/xylan/chitin deacetylase (PgdA/CDA1 family)